ncbi:hypothetical protein AVEN_260706-1 [Araneus ventricosus]|uniref:Transposase Tc1-like domain-containing protein n=1 Tax=Araneus ventricosus TaxID=182803 RepID=A0A4Y2WCQ6_ARAVE|nr:hypothetical protein AVEN_260706-1 [Araneus ventricosus]
MVHFEVKKKQALKPHHKSQRMLWARNHISYGPKWQSAIFSDEEKREKYHLDGPDGWTSYWCDLREEPQCFFSRRQDCGSVIVWEVLQYTSCICTLPVVVKHQNYTTKTLEENLLLIAELLGAVSGNFSKQCVFPLFLYF